MKKFNIAIDGPAGAGKSTIARLVANALGFVYVDTGAMYRAITWKMLQQNLIPDQAEAVIELARQTKIELIPNEDGQQVFVDGNPVTNQLRKPEVNFYVSAVSGIGPVREVLVAMQKELAAQKGVVMDGRDIGTKVLPDAEVKIFLTASREKRAQRRLQEMQEAGMETTFEQLVEDIARRDRLDEQREISPLVRAEDAVLLDSTELSIEQVVDRILDLCKANVGGGK
ncbi:(d)CMP kinase [Paenibacillus larvae]|uniref:Cytidylate kinase n=1 Tax=Paenibacillus larvae subsp. larvae DSM 25430 TaxID=697284 RepID=V9W4S6_9BACL|nr:(d)CMP kinase [Paenibacillus larvae]AHD05163.1 cytidylate kinase Cmk [Paenibacillus larvae subsp. larvae DSM 25430]AVG11710.1 cytidylate kinase Cmk [Paenibacillus larvae subsp. larvae DSM 25430]MDR5570155.1 (d)CMP kinase [Paenibacillus larvae]MDR5595475.1 (d)CMP kinase [Paenibacillus larvae]